MNQRLQASDWTFAKEEIFLHFLLAYSAIAEAIQKKHAWVKRWFYFELTAGSGLINNGSHPIEGSPLIALETFRKRSQLEIDCLFVEHNSHYAAELQNIVTGLRSKWPLSDSLRVKHTICCNDHCQVMKNYTLAYPFGPMGLLYWDGLGRDIYPTEELYQWLTKNRKHDLLVMASANAQKRMGRPRLDQVLAKTPRLVWLTEPRGKWEWIFAFATDWDELPHKLSRHGFELFRSDSDRGKQIVDTLGTTYKERGSRDQLELW